MVNQAIVDILVNRIKNGGINPNTGMPMQLEDIKILDYKNAVNRILNPIAQD